MSLPSLNHDPGNRQISPTLAYILIHGPGDPDPKLETATRNLLNPLDIDLKIKFRRARSVSWGRGVEPAT